MNWEQVKLFLGIAEQGSLLGASEKLGLSPPTLARHVTRLEDSLGLQLFERRSDGYRLTKQAEALLPAARQLEKAARAMEHQALQLMDTAHTRVRLASGFWFSKIITEQLADFHAANPDIELELVTAHAIADLDQGEADISIRNVRPEKGNLVMRKLGETTYAVYGSKDYVTVHPAAMSEDRYRACDWIGAAPPLAKLSSQVWLQGRLQKEPILRCSQTLQFLDAVKSGIGLTVLPQIIGNREDDLVRVSDPVDFGTNEVWLIVHERMRGSPVVRRVIDWLVPLFQKMH